MTMIFRSIVCAAYAIGVRRRGVHGYTTRWIGPSAPTVGRPSMVRLVPSGARPRRPRPTGVVGLSSNFYDDFEDFGELGSSGDSSEEDDKTGSGKGIGGDDPKAAAAGGDDSAASTDDDAVMRELRERMNDLSRQKDDNIVEEDEDDDEEENDDDDADSGSALPDLEGNTISSVDDLIGFAQAKAREKAKGSKVEGAFTGGGGGTWEDENWARPIPHIDEETGELLDLNAILEGGIVLVANPAKFCSDLAEEDEKPSKERGNSFLGGLFDDPFPTSSQSSSKSPGGISPALLAKFGITLPPSPDLGPDRRADLLPVVLLIDRDPLRGCRAVLMNRRTGNLMGDLPPSLFGPASPGDNGAGGEGGVPSPHPLAAFMIQPLWWAGSSPGGGAGDGGAPQGRGGGGVRAIDMIHACPYVNGSIPLARSDGLYWGGSPVQAQEAMRDGRLDRPLSGFDFKFFIQSTRWTPAQLEQEINDGVWILATVSKEVLFRSRDRLGAKRAKPLWTEILELMGDDYRHIRDQLYGEEEE